MTNSNLETILCKSTIYLVQRTVSDTISVKCTYTQIYTNGHRRMPQMPKQSHTSSSITNNSSTYKPQQISPPYEP